MKPVRKRPSNLFLFRVAFLVLYGNVGIVYPFFALYLKDIGLTYHQISILQAMFGLVVILFQQYWGYLADMVFTKKQILIVTTLLACGVFYSISLTTSFWMILVLYFFYRTIRTPRGQVLTSLLLMDRMGEANFALVRAYGSLGFIITNILTGIAAESLGLRCIFPFYIGISLLFVLAMYPIKAREERPAKRHSFWDVQKFFLKNPVIRLFLVLVFFYQAFHSLATLFISFVIKDLGGTTITISVLYSFAAVIELFVFFYTDRLIARFGELPLIFVAILAQVVRWVLVYNVRFLTTFLFIQALHPITFGIFYCCAVSFMNKHAGRHLKASAQTMFGFVYFGLAGMLGNLVGGQIVEILGLRTLYLFAALGACIAMAILFKLRKEMRKIQAGTDGAPRTQFSPGEYTS